MTKLSGDNEIFVNNEAFENKIDDLVFQYIRETFNIKKKNLQREHHYKFHAKI